MIKLSLCIATYNEEKFIHYPLDSAYDLVDEVIIVDGGSIDKTVEIAKSYGDKVKVFIEDNPQMFHINKQKAIERARGEWVLQLDADEALSDELKTEIENIVTFSVGVGSSDPLINNKTVYIKGAETAPLHKSFIAYYIPRKNFFLSRFLTKGGVYPDYTIRLYRNGVVRFPCKNVHENVEIIPNSESRIHNSKFKIGYFHNPILHYADPDFLRYLKRWHRYNALDVKLLIQDKKRPAFFDYCILKPVSTFFSMFVRHKGFMDGLPGLIFAFFSSIRYVDVYFKWVKAKT